MRVIHVELDRLDKPTEEQQVLAQHWEGVAADEIMIRASDKTSEGWILLGEVGLVQPGSWDEQHRPTVPAWIEYDTDAL